VKTNPRRNHEPEAKDHATLINGDSVTLLQRVPFVESFKNEDWLQKLLFQYPQLIPVSEIEPTFEGLIPLARELSTGVGPIDLLYMNSSGYLTLVETKLWRNPESRRTVIGQDHRLCQGISRLSYEGLLDAIRRVDPKLSHDRILELARNTDPHFDAARFHDTLARTIASGRFLY